jgi:hypothetical protein
MLLDTFYIAICWFCSEAPLRGFKDAWCLCLEVLHGAVGLLVDNGDEKPELRLAQ